MLSQQRAGVYYVFLKFLQSPSFSFLFFDNVSSFIQYPIEGVFILNIKFQIM